MQVVQTNDDVMSTRRGDPTTKAAVVVLLLLLPFVGLAFWPLYLSRPFARVDFYTHMHATTGALWFMLVIVQPLLARWRRVALHRSLGRFSYLLAPCFVVAGILLAHYRLHTMTNAKFATEAPSYYLPFYASMVFSLAYVLGLRYRRREPVAHGRFMLLKMIPLIDPVLGRVLFFYIPPLPASWLYQAATFGLATVAAALLVFSYRRQHRARRELIAYFAVLVTLEVGWFTVTHSSAWVRGVDWFRRLPLT